MIDTEQIADVVRRALGATAQLDGQLAGIVVVLDIHLPGPDSTLMIWRSAEGMSTAHSIGMLDMARQGMTAGYIPERDDDE